MVFVYRIGLVWGEKKSICNKFPAASPVACLAWPAARPSTLFFGALDGKVQLQQQ